MIFDHFGAETAIINYIMPGEKVKRLCLPSNEKINPCRFLYINDFIDLIIE